MSELPSGQPESSGPPEPALPPAERPADAPGAPFPPAGQSGATAVGGGYTAPQYGAPAGGPYGAAGGPYAAPAGGPYGAPPYGAPAGGPYAAPAGGPYAAPGGGQYGAPAGGQYAAPAGGQYAAPGGGEYGAPGGGQYGAPPYGAPAGGPYGAPVPPAGYGPGGPGGGRPKKSHTKLIIALIAAVVLIAVVLVGVFALAGGGAKPQEAVTTYLQDLAKGDAAGALKQGAAPASTKLLTDDTLKQQQAIAKISNIKVVSEQVVGSRAQVHVTYAFGSKNADSTYSLIKSGSDWKITQTAYPIDVSDIRDIPQLTLFGIDISKESKVYVFPGPLKWGSGSKYFAVTDDKSADFSTGPDDTSGLFVTLKADLSDAGKTAIADAVGKFIGACAASTSLAPAGCPQQEFDSYGVDGTAKWTAPADLSTVKYDTFGDPATTVDVSGDLTWSVTYQAKDFDGNVTTATDSDVSGYVSGKVDLTQSTPTFTADS